MVRWSPSAGAASYVIGVAFGDGRRIAFFPPATDRQLSLTDVPADDTVAVTIQGRSDIARLGRTVVAHMGAAK